MRRAAASRAQGATLERTTPNRSTVSLNVMLLPHERHGHLRPAADLATTYAGELREWCAGRGAARRAWAAAELRGIDAGLLAVKHHPRSCSRSPRRVTTRTSWQPRCRAPRGDVD